MDDRSWRQIRNKRAKNRPLLPVAHLVALLSQPGRGSLNGAKYLLGGQTMLRISAIALVATAMSIGLAEGKSATGLVLAKAHARALSPCQTEQQAKATCACGPAKIACPAGMYCHAFENACTR